VGKGLLIYSLKAGSLDSELLPKLVSGLGDVIKIDIEHLQEEGGTLRYAEANHCDWIAVAGGDGTVESVASDWSARRTLWALFPQAHSITLPEAFICPSTRWTLAA
jgi:diacylglycerol kinase family enzyme